MFNKSKIIQGLMRATSISDEQLYELIKFDIDIYWIRARWINTIYSITNWIKSHKMN